MAPTKAAWKVVTTSKTVTCYAQCKNPVEAGSITLAYNSQAVLAGLDGSGADSLTAVQRASVKADLEKAVANHVLPSTKPASNAASENVFDDSSSSSSSSSDDEDAAPPSVKRTISPLLGSSSKSSAGPPAPRPIARKKPRQSPAAAAVAALSPAPFLASQQAANTATALQNQTLALQNQAVALELLRSGRMSEASFQSMSVSQAAIENAAGGNGQ
ncbi:hypothetical protein TeGR_g4007 [Tetraparma gracilis]|uniref:Uncharacterized protein n=1 Tax=Tetraparma gracilis TaxID=2962635 RepID=A0ABQ6NBT6_9STRA|nr:hypothetical protein TeGR_g4007 [Tetraparma gracilis]